VNVVHEAVKGEPRIGFGQTFPSPSGDHHLDVIWKLGRYLLGQNLNGFPVGWIIEDPKKKNPLFGSRPPGVASVRETVEVYAVGSHLDLFRRETKSIYEPGSVGLANTSHPIGRSENEPFQKIDKPPELMTVALAAVPLHVVFIHPERTTSKKLQERSVKAGDETGTHDSLDTVLLYCPVGTPQEQRVEQGR
jgi:hypothetical protein